MPRKRKLGSWLLIAIGLSALPPSLSGQDDPAPSTVERIQSQYPDLPWQAIGLLQASESKKSRIYQTGFFIAPNLFLTAVSPRKAQPSKIDCVDDTYIFSGAEKIAPDFENQKVKPSHHCVGVHEESAEHGFTVLEVESLTNDTVVTRTAINSSQPTLEEGERLLILGYAYRDGGGELKLVENSRVQKPVYAFDDAFVQENFSGRRINLFWSLASQSLSPGMVGSAVFRRSKGRWWLAGMVGMLQDPKGSANNAPTVFTKVFQFKDLLFLDEEEK